MSPKAVVEQMYDAYAKGDIDTTFSFFHEDVLHTANKGNDGAAFCGVFCGLGAMRQRIEAVGAVLSFESYVPTVLVADGNRVAAMVDVTSCHRETGARFDSTISHFLVVENGKITELIEFFDTALANALTAPEAEPAS